MQESEISIDGNIGKSSGASTPLHTTYISNSNDFDPEEQETKGKPQEFKLYGYRHFELALYCFAAMCNQITWISLQPVAGAIQNGYGYGTSAISTIGIIYMIVFILVNYPSNQVIDKKGLRIAVTLGMCLTTCGMIVKCFVNKSFVWVIVGQVIAACGQPLLAIAPAKLATYWFGQNERVIATTIATAAQPLGVAVGFVFPSLFVKAADADAGADNVENARHHIFQSQLWQAIVGICVFVLLLIFFREKPKTAPSASSGTEKTESVMENSKAVLRDPNFVKLIYAFGIIICMIAIFGPLAFLGSLYTGEVWTVCIACFLLGFDLAILPVGIDFGVEMTFPIAEPISTGLLMSFSQVFGIILVVSCTALVGTYGREGCLYSQIILIGMAAIGLVFGCSVKEDLKRFNYENETRLTTEQNVLSCQETARDDLGSNDTKVYQTMTMK